MKTFQNKIITPIASLKKYNSNLSPLTSQLIFGETVEILDKRNNWYFCRCHSKSYSGWVKNNNIGLLPTSTHYVSNISSLVFEKPDIKSKLKCNLYLNSKITVLNYYNEWVKIALHRNQKGYMPSRHIALLSEHSKNWIQKAREFKNTPYLWGGKTCLGLDCSGLVQTCLEASGLKIPRDSIDQLSFSSEKIKEVTSINRGCLIFWSGHVGIATSKSKILHSNSYHMSVIEENLSGMQKRIPKNESNILGIKQVLL